LYSSACCPNWSRRSDFRPINIYDVVGQCSFTSRIHMFWTFSSDGGATSEKQITNTSVLGYENRRRFL
jgi:hypothetical protein